VECPGSTESRSLLTVLEDLVEFVNVRAIVCDQFDDLFLPSIDHRQQKNSAYVFRLEAHTA
jgi:hypothetical protein